MSTRYSRVNLLTSLIILVITGVAYFLVIHYILTKDLDKDLVVEEEEIEEYIRLYKALPPAGNFKDQIVRYSFTPAVAKRKFSDTEYENTREHESEPGRSLITSVMLNGKPVTVEIIKSKVESEDLVRIIFLITLAIILLLLVSLALANRLVLNRLWKPFHSILAQLQAFNIADNHEMHQHNTDIDEFAELNQAAIALATRVKSDYRELKVFTDNASHELMTPLAVINSKLDTLLQTGPFTEGQGELLEDIYNGVSRLSRLNQSMLLIAKIDNNLIGDVSSISLKALVQEKAKQFQELIHAQGISVELELGDKTLLMSTYLADILMNNLIGNAIRHNIPGGQIRIVLSEKSLSVSNSGEAQALNSVKIFERFNKDSHSDGMGLGLSIAKQICNYYRYHLSYHFLNGKHTFSVQF